MVLKVVILVVLLIKILEIIIYKSMYFFYLSVKLKINLAYAFRLARKDLNSKWVTRKHKIEIIYLFSLQLLRINYSEALEWKNELYKLSLKDIKLLEESHFVYSLIIVNYFLVRKGVGIEKKEILLEWLYEADNRLENIDEDSEDYMNFIQYKLVAYGSINRYTDIIKMVDEILENEKIELDEGDQITLLFYKGHAYSQLGEKQAAFNIFNTIKHKMPSIYKKIYIEWIFGKFYDENQEYERALNHYVEVKKLSNFLESIDYYSEEIQRILNDVKTRIKILKDYKT